MEWIKKEKELPSLEQEENGFVHCLIYTNAKRTIRGMFNTRTQNFLDMSFSSVSIVTHWMPLPEPPKI